MKKTQAEIDQLKQSWESDPCWDLESTEGFEDHFDELKNHRITMQAMWIKAEAMREWQRTAALSKRADELGVPGNIKLVQYIDSLEARIKQLEEK